MIDQLKGFLDELKALRKDVKAETKERIAKKDLRGRAENLGSKWFAEVSPLLTSAAGFSAETVEKYSAGCADLIKLSAPNGYRKRYLAALDGLIKPFRDDLILPAQRVAGRNAAGSRYQAFLKDLPDAQENEYLSEAVACARQGYFRAAVVLGWSAAMDRIHRRIEKEGFARFNITSASMASATKGRFRKFNQTQSVNSLSELRTVFDTTILWIIEGIGWIDANQHTRLRSCFDMRNQGAHPGEAPITEYNLLSFMSDIDVIVLKNPTFAL